MFGMSSRVAKQLIAQRRDHEPYNWDAYASTFFPKAEELEAKAQQALDTGDLTKASELFL